MSELEDKLGAILGNPQMMQQIMAMAQSMGGNAHAEQKQEQSPAAPANLIPACSKALRVWLATVILTKISSHCFGPWGHT